MNFKPKYCSWDVRDLATDHSWTELSDSRDAKDLRFKKLVSEDLGLKDTEIVINVHVLSGNLCIYSENQSSERTLLCKTTCLEFDQLETIFSLESSLVKNNFYTGDSLTVKNEAKMPKIYSSNILETSDEISDEFSKMQNILQKWDKEEF